MQIKNRKLEIKGDCQEISVLIGDFRLWYRVPKYLTISNMGDPFLAAALLPAMARGEELEFDENLPVSSKLLQNAYILQEIFHSWNPSLKIIPIKAIPETTNQSNDGIVCFFSGGVDSIFTFIKRKDELTHVVYIRGFDFPIDNESYKTVLDRNAEFVSRYRKVIIPIETNLRELSYYHNLSILLTQGSILASIALLLGFPRVYISSSYSYSQLIPLGSHPLTDPLWSNEATEIIHDGAEARRVDKIVRIAEDPAALSIILVCARDVVRNCGCCEKCIRTMIPLRVLGVKSPAFPDFPKLSVIKKLQIKNEIEMIFFKENLDLAINYGDKDLVNAMRAYLRRYEMIQLLKEVDRVVLGGFIKRTHRRIIKKPSFYRITMTPREYLF
ncbi:MAG: hypothetical protein QHH43_07725 [Candidatus Saccharicenans sp.]|jgi:hypothetical protein|nr:hypothetical protein [Candidatus Saccharicenans sp.]MDH7575626.1 hypothetical protein [Candidatus Saccharicenans sp.]